MLRIGHGPKSTCQADIRPLVGPIRGPKKKLFRRRIGMNVNGKLDGLRPFVFIHY